MLMGEEGIPWRKNKTMSAPKQTQSKMRRNEMLITEWAACYLHSGQAYRGIERGKGGENSMSEPKPTITHNKTHRCLMIGSVHTHDSQSHARTLTHRRLVCVLPARLERSYKMPPPNISLVLQTKKKGTVCIVSPVASTRRISTGIWNWISCIICNLHSCDIFSNRSESSTCSSPCVCHLG